MCWLQQSAQLWSYPTFLLVPLMIIGGIECFAGYRAWRLLLGLNGAVLGFVAGAMTCVLLGVPMLVFVGALGGAVAGAALFARVAALGSFVFAFGSMASLAILLAQLAAAPPRTVMPLAAATGLVAAVAALAMCRQFMILLVAIAGAQQVASAWRAHELAHEIVPSPELISNSELAVFLTLAAAGLLLQFADFALSSRRHRSRVEAKAPDVQTSPTFVHTDEPAAI